MGPLLETGGLLTTDRQNLSFFRFLNIILIAFSVIGLIYLTYILFLKDLYILFKEKQRRTQTTTGFGGNLNNNNNNNNNNI